MHPEPPEAPEATITRLVSEAKKREKRPRFWRHKSKRNRAVRVWCWGNLIIGGDLIIHKDSSS